MCDNLCPELPDNRIDLKTFGVVDRSCDPSVSPNNDSALCPKVPFSLFRTPLVISPLSIGGRSRLIISRWAKTEELTRNKSAGPSIISSPQVINPSKRFFVSALDVTSTRITIEGLLKPTSCTTWLVLAQRFLSPPQTAQEIPLRSLL
jgi:hypothetical protein